MITTPYPLLFQPAAAASALRPATVSGQVRPRRLRLYLVGSPDDTQATIDYFHLRHCIERIAWSPRALEIPPAGVVIRPDPGDVLRYLQRTRRFE